MLTKHVHFIYDVFDNLIGEQDDDTGDGTYDHQEFYVVDASPAAPVAGQPPAEATQPLLEFNGSQQLVERFLVAPNPAGIYAVVAQGAVSSLSQGDVVVWMADDNLGTPRDEVDNTGTLVNHSVFSSFGDEVYDSNPTIAHWAAFAGGHVSAATGFEIEDERWLDAATGRWLSEDPVGFGAGDANVTRYVGNNPASFIDPSGLGPIFILPGMQLYYETNLQEQQMAAAARQAWLQAQAVASAAMEAALQKLLAAATKERLKLQAQQIVNMDEQIWLIQNFKQKEIQARLQKLQADQEQIAKDVQLMSQVKQKIQQMAEAMKNSQ